eukprot:TRINITY_DN73324_c0_g1_i1.p1 TRINITY_DN73324_c0_g1~~TRINITY_DN73324_c0_g1_i1.p1  ORF type:complete len:256 (+),score=42.50 TRINITY_DN73324_c0_g1_i1:113-769(+)
MHALIEPLESRPVWHQSNQDLDHDLVSLRQRLESGAQQLLEGWLDFKQHWTYEALALSPYPRLTFNGTWRKWTFYRNGDGWNRELCSGFPLLCSMLGTSLAERSQGAQVLGPSQEEVAINELTPGTHILPHAGPQYRLQLHMGLAGLKDSYLGVFTGSWQPDGEPDVAYETWQAGVVTPIFDDSYTHYTRASPFGLEARAVLDVGVLQPDFLRKYKAQ